MVDLEILDEHGCSAEKWRKLFEDKPSDPKGSMGGMMSDINALPTDEDPKNDRQKRAKLIRRVKSRSDSGRDVCLSNWRPYHAADLIWNSPSRQISPTLLSSIIAQVTSPEEGIKVLSSYGFDTTQVMWEAGATDPKTGLPQKKINLPAFITTIVPLARSYQEIRKAKLVNDRNRNPLIPFDPIIKTTENRLKSSVVEQRVQVMAQQYNYLNILDQQVHGMLLYRTSLMFPKEEWHYEEQIRYTKPEVPSAETVEGDKKEKRKKFESVVVQEGIRYEVCHPNRCYWDRSYNIKSLLTDAGCRWVGHYRVLLYDELKYASGFYNLDSISFGNSVNWWVTNRDFINVYFNQCVMKSPTITPPENADRDTWVAENAFYGGERGDQAVVVTEHFEKVNPVRDGLGTYPHDIWARFVLAGDGTIIYASPIAYTPALPCQDNGDDKLIEDASLVQKLAGYQDQISNLLTQYVLAVKQNLTNINFLDENVVSKEDIKQIRNLGQSLYTGINIFNYDSKVLNRMQVNVSQAVTKFRFDQLNTKEIIEAIRIVIDIAERVLQFSSQEVAQAATHEQTKAEVERIGAATTNVLQYTALPVDMFMAAWGQQLYEAWMNYGEDDFAVQVPYETNMTKDRLEKMGFTLVEEANGVGSMAHVQGKKSAVELMTFAYVPTNLDRSNKLDVAREMAVFARDLATNPMTAQAIGPEQFLMIANTIAKLAGLPLETPLKFTGKTPEQQQQEVQTMLQQLTETIMANVKQGMMPMMEKITTTDQKVDALYKMLQLPPPETNAPANTNIGPGEAQGPTGVAQPTIGQPVAAMA